jgi:energy-coupling factor transporter ATP-binding protein EcfA2
MGVPRGAKVFQLKDGAKTPAVPGAHFSALSQEDFTQVGQNVGISLKNGSATQFICADMDRLDQALKNRLDAEDTWCQATPHAWHWLFLPPEGFQGINGKLPGLCGELKCDGYIVGPGSSVVCSGTRHNDLVACSATDYVHLGQDEVKPCPQWLLDYINTPTKTVEHESVSVVPTGFRHDFLYGLAKYARKEWGLDEAGIKGMLLKGPRAVLEGDNPTGPYSDAEVVRIARDASKRAVDLGSMKLSSGNTTCGLEIPMVREPIRWWVRGFIPKGRYIGLYGPGGCGKTTFAGWLASEVTKKGASFLYIGVEEDGDEFVPKARLAGTDGAKIHSLDNPLSFTFPKDVDRLKAEIIATGAEVVYFDSIYNHFASSEGMTTPERDRKALGSLDLLAKETKATIIGVFHLKRDGTFNGSAEMENVPRYLLTATRPKDRPLRIRVKKTNLLNKGMVMQFGVTPTPLADLETGEVQLEEMEDGELAPFQINVPHRIPDISEEEAETDEATIIQMGP